MSGEQPFEMLGLDHIVIRCVDLESMKQFYCGVLGCTVDRHNEKFGLFQVRAGAHLIDLIPIDGILGSKGGAAPGAEGLNPPCALIWTATASKLSRPGPVTALREPAPASIFSIRRGIRLNSRAPATLP